MDTSESGSFGGGAGGQTPDTPMSVGGGGGCQCQGSTCPSCGGNPDLNSNTNVVGMASAVTAAISSSACAGSGQTGLVLCASGPCAVCLCAQLCMFACVRFESAIAAWVCFDGVVCVCTCMCMWCVHECACMCMYVCVCVCTPGGGGGGLGYSNCEYGAGYGVKMAAQVSLPESFRQPHVGKAAVNGTCSADSQGT